jgi:hypothetical protein
MAAGSQTENVQQSDEARTKTKDFWDKLQSASGVISGLLIFAIGYVASDRVKLALEQRKFQFENVKEMRDVLMKLGDSKITQEQAEAESTALSLFGEPAIAPLIIQLNKEQNQGLGAKQGLRALGLIEAPKTCSHLAGVIEHRSGLFSLWAQEAAVDLLQELNCRAQMRTLESYERLLNQAATERGRQKFATTVRDPTNVTVESLASLTRQVQTALAALKGGP